MDVTALFIGYIIMLVGGICLLIFIVNLCCEASCKWLKISWAVALFWTTRSGDYRKGRCSRCGGPIKDEIDKILNRK